jgi:hypothetical protein
MNDLSGKYFVRKSVYDDWEDVTTKFGGVKILSVDGFNEIGEAKNIYTAQWVDTQDEDYILAGDSVVRANADLSVTFIVGNRYGASDTQAVHDEFIDYMCKQGDLYIRSAYNDKSAHVVCLKGYKPTTQKLHRGINSYILGTITLHMLDTPAT